MNPMYFANTFCSPCATTIRRECSYLCDYPVTDGGTCDAPICNTHAHRLAEKVPMSDEKGDFIDDVHVCPNHLDEWIRNGKPKFWLKSK